MFERRTVFKAALATSATVLVAACSSDDSAAPGTGGAAGGDVPEQPKAQITATPVVGAKDAPVSQPVVLKVAEGKFTDVKVTNAEGKVVEGDFDAEKTTWTSKGQLGYGKSYTYAAKAAGTDSKEAQLTGAFDTVKPAKEIRVTLNPGDDAEVGVAMPISVKFASPVKDKAAAQKALVVEPSQKVEGEWAWLSDKQADWRPKEYWPAGTSVKVTAKVYGIDLGGGMYAKDDVSTEFKIGRNQVVKINTPDHVMKVYRNGKESASYPASNGLDSVTDRNTPNGTFIVMTKEPTARFDNARYGYTNVNKKWACRISNHGEYIHENQDNASAIGNTNNSHGCVNLLDKDAKAYFDSAMIGDPVEVTGSKLNAVTTSDVMDWLLDWKTWQSKSAL
ncbi:L,D-transpeptidase [Amycolatopsis minnesotensis]|uniref:Ig-like domain-containing protein n=1 Tax=Amycolatopsis minnesotensis TaxID=337894 RepID=A0ABN2S4X8_9PSEU